MMSNFSLFFSKFLIVLILFFLRWAMHSFLISYAYLLFVFLIFIIKSPHPQPKSRIFLFLQSLFIWGQHRPLQAKYWVLEATQQLRVRAGLKTVQMYISVYPQTMFETMKRKQQI